MAEPEEIKTAKRTFAGAVSSWRPSISDVIGFGLVVATLLLWYSTKALVEGADQNAEKQLRAYVFVDTSLISNLASRQPTADLSIKNFGQTPAYKVKASMSISLAAFPATGALSPSPDIHQISQMDLGPGGTITLSKATNVPIAPEIIERMRSGSTALYIHGTVDYVDAFGHPRFTHFRLFKGGNAGVNGPSLSHAGEGNEAN